MQRFRRKSETRKDKRKDDLRGSISAPFQKRQHSLEQLPEMDTGDFRTSLILPHLTKRFSMLRGSDGRLVHEDVMQTHLSAQRQTGRLTAYEMNAVMAQFRLQHRNESHVDLSHPQSNDAPSALLSGSDWLSPTFSANEDDNEGLENLHEGVTLAANESDIQSNSGTHEDSSDAQVGTSRCSSPSARHQRVYGSLSSPVSPIQATQYSPKSPSTPSSSFLPYANRENGENTALGSPYRHNGLSSPGQRSGSVLNRSRKSYEVGRVMEMENIDSKLKSKGKECDQVAALEEDMNEEVEKNNLAEEEEDEVLMDSGNEEDLEISDEVMPLSRSQINRISSVLDDIGMKIFTVPRNDRRRADFNSNDRQGTSGDSTSADVEGSNTNNHRSQDSRTPPLSSQSPAAPAIPFPASTSTPSPSKTSALEYIDLSHTRQKSRSLASAFQYAPKNNSTTERPASPEKIRQGEVGFKPTMSQSSSSLESMLSKSPKRFTRSGSLNSPVQKDGVRRSAIPFSPAISTSPTSTRSPQTAETAKFSPTSPRSPRTRSQAYAAAQERTKAALAARGLLTHRDDDTHSLTDSLDSTGSSYHEMEASDDETRTQDINFVRDSITTLGSLGPTSVRALALKGVMEDDEGQSQEFQRSTPSYSGGKPMAELLQGSDLAHTDLALADLFAIQNSLVRSASKKAAAKEAQKRSLSLSSSSIEPQSTKQASHRNSRRGSPYTEESEGESFMKSSRSPMVKDRGRWNQDTISTAETTTLPDSLYEGRSSIVTWQTESSPNGMSGVPTPSTARSDAFEFASVYGSGSPETLAERSAGTKEFEGERSITPGGEDRHSQGSFAVLEEDEREAHLQRQSSDGGARPSGDSQRSNDVAPSSSVDTLAAPTSKEDSEQSTAILGTPVQLIRSSRDTSQRERKTQSVLIRDVRNQATLATIALKKQSPVSPAGRNLTKKRSVRNAAISSPQFVSGPRDIHAVPIPQPTQPSPTSPESFKLRDSTSGHDSTLSRSGTGLGLRFKMLLRKQNKGSSLQSKSDDVVDFESPLSPSYPAPLTTPQRIARMRSSGSTPEYPPSPDLAYSPEDNRQMDHYASRSLAALQENEESPPSSDIAILARGNGRVGAKKFTAVAESGNGADKISSFNSPAASTKSENSPYHLPSSRRSTPSNGRKYTGEAANKAGGHGLGVDLGPKRNGDVVGSARTEALPKKVISLMSQTAPLSIGRKGSLDSATPESNTPDVPPYAHRPRANHSTSASIDSMTKLWAAAEDLGLPPDKIQELVHFSYPQSPQSEMKVHSASASTSSTFKTASDLGDKARVLATGALAVAHRRGASDGSYKSHRRIQSNSSSNRSIRNRAQTSPPTSHRKKVTREMQAEAVLLPTITKDSPRTHSPTNLRRGTQQSVDSDGDWLRPPTSQSDRTSIQSFRSSDYAGSVFDLYGASDEERGLEEDVGAGEDEEDAVMKKEETPVWSVADALRTNRASTGSGAERFSFDSRHSSFFHTSPSHSSANSAILESDEKSAIRATRFSRTGMAGEMPPPRARFPSVYVRDEHRLLALGKEGGIAQEENGMFMVRPIGTEEDPESARGRKLEDWERHLEV